MQMFSRLPKNGMYYQFWVSYSDTLQHVTTRSCLLTRFEYPQEEELDGKKAGTVQRILPANMSTKIMVQLRKKYTKTTKNDFDNAIAELFNSASAAVKKLSSDGKNTSYDVDFWRGPKVGTIFENVSDKTTHRFAIKMLEARNAWIERQRDGQNISEGSAKYECQAAKAIDRFNANVEVANLGALASGRVDALEEGHFSEAIDFGMSSLFMDQLDEDSDTEESDLSEDEAQTQPRSAKRAKLENADTADDGIETPAAKRVKVEKAGVTDSVARFDPTLIFRTAQLSLGGSAPESSNGAEEVRLLGASVHAAFVARQTPEIRALIEEDDRKLEEMLKRGY